MTDIKLIREQILALREHISAPYPPSQFTVANDLLNITSAICAVMENLQEIQTEMYYDSLGEGV